MESTSVGRRSFGLLLLASLGCGAWAVWPQVFPAPRAPLVMREVLPVPEAPAAPVYPETVSIRPLVSGRVNLNIATAEQVEALPGVGPALAERMMAARPLRGLSDLDAVRGVGPKLLEKLAPRVSF